MDRIEVKCLRANGNELFFISRIKRDGSGTVYIDLDDKPYLEYLQTLKCELFCLSLTEKTFVANCGMNCYVVRLIESTKATT